jgi:hypothetical protein
MHSSISAPRRRSPFLVLVPLFVAATGLASAQASPGAVDTDPFPVGSGVIEVDFRGTPLNLHFYKPADYAGERFILLFHGASRAAAGYRDGAAGMADLFESLVVVPEFDLERFPNRTYQFGGIFREDGSFADADEWTYAYVPELIEYIRRREGDPGLPHLILGFSAGGQFVSRMAAFLDTEAERIVVISPGSCIFPTRDLKFGLGSVSASEDCLMRTAAMNGSRGSWLSPSRYTSEPMTPRWGSSPPGTPMRRGSTGIPGTSGGSTKPWTWPTTRGGSSTGGW